MNALAVIDDAGLAVLETKARTLSTERHYLHHQIDNLYLSAPLDDARVDLLYGLEEREQTISSERRELHRQIDDLRAELSLPRWRPALSIHKQSDVAYPGLDQPILNAADLHGQRNVAEHRERRRRVI